MLKPRILKLRTDRIVCRQGTAAIEAALIMPVVFFVFLGAIDIAQYINMSQVVTNASREGARAASRSNTESAEDVEAVVNRYLQKNYPGLSSGSNAIKVDVNKVGDSDNENSNGSFGSIESGDTISINVIFDFDAVRWLPGPDYWGGQSYSQETFCRRQ